MGFTVLTLEGGLGAAGADLARSDGGSAALRRKARRCVCLPSTF